MVSQVISQKPEVLSPAGSPEALQAAVHAGADAVYLGVTDFNARVRARNFTLDELPDVLADLHRWGVRAYITFNTLIFAEEESGARRALETIARAGADAVIVQDLGVVRWIHTIAPGLPIHASTQMTVTSADGIAPLERLGVQRVILGRELSVPEIARIRAATSMELEVFVHGALCVSYSGQCLSSEAWGGRSANRGQCAQACRLPYDLLVDDRLHELGDRAYLLSPRDLEGYRRIPDLTRVGVATVKIEGRMKGPEYVSAATRLYRSAVDRAWEQIEAEQTTGNMDPDAQSPGSATNAIEHLAWEARQVFSRGASEGFLGGINHQVLVDGRTRSHRGIEIGRVVRVEPAELPHSPTAPPAADHSKDHRGRNGQPRVAPGTAGSSSQTASFPKAPPQRRMARPRGSDVRTPLSLVVEIAAERANVKTGAMSGPGKGGKRDVGTDAKMDLRPGDGLLLAVSPLEEDERGGRIAAAEEIRTQNGRPRQFRVWFARESGLDLREIPVSTPVYRTAHPELLNAIRNRITHPDRRVALHLRASGAVGTPLELSTIDPEGRTVTVRSTTPLAPAERSPLSETRLREQLGRLGDTRYALAILEVAITGAAFLPVSELNRMRREFTAALDDLRKDPLRRDSAEGTSDDPLTSASETLPSLEASAPDETLDLSETPGESLSPITWAVDQAELRQADRTDRDTAAHRHRPAPANLRKTITSERSALEPRRDATLSESFEDRVLVLCRNHDQLRGALAGGARRIVLDFLDLVGLKSSFEEAREAGARVTLALPRIQKPGEEKIEAYFLAREPDEILVRSLASLERLGYLQRTRRSGGVQKEPTGTIPRPAPLLVGDVSLNGVNPTSIETLWELGLDRLAPGLDLNGEQLQKLMRLVDTSRIEIPLHHHLPVFHTEHCVFAAFLSDGADFRTCGRPCDRHHIALRDRTGQEHAVIADVGCRNTVFGARPQSALPYLRALRTLGVAGFRIELVSESTDSTLRLVNLYRQAWNGSVGVEDTLLELRAEGRYGVSTGVPEPPRHLVTKPVGGRREQHRSRHGG